MKKNTKKTYEVVKIDGTVYRTNYIELLSECKSSSQSAYQSLLK